MATKRCPTTEQVAAMIAAAGGGGGANIKGGIIAANTGANEHTFGTAFVTVPKVTLEPMGTLALRDCLHKLTAVSETGFNFEVDVAADYIWIAIETEDL